MKFLEKSPVSATSGARKARLEMSSRNFLACPYCDGELKKVKDSRPSVIGQTNEMVIRRRRCCDKCGQSSGTLEVSEEYLIRLRSDALMRIAGAIMSGEIK
jgi:uncharacterized protein YbaR (Trm112 family)